MSIINEARLVVVQDDANGKATFVDVPRPGGTDTPGVVHGAFFWGTENAPSLPEYIGEVPAEHGFPGVGATRFGMFEWAPHSAGKFDAAALLDDVAVGEGGDPAMHASNTLDYEVILSGKVDLELPGGQVVTLAAGDMLVMGGSAHAWKNRYDEPCRYAAILIGAARPAPTPVPIRTDLVTN